MHVLLRPVLVASMPSSARALLLKSRDALGRKEQNSTGSWTAQDLIHLRPGACCPLGTGGRWQQLGELAGACCPRGTRRPVAAAQ
eukprot:353568-Chlamydomonas_euryale.AAC.9